jgi:transposase
LFFLGPVGSHPDGVCREEPGMEATEENAELVERIAALDIGKAVLTACIRIPHENIAGQRRQEVAEYATTTGALLRLADRMRKFGVTRVAMEATSDYVRHEGA